MRRIMGPFQYIEFTKHPFRTLDSRFARGLNQAVTLANFAAMKTNLSSCGGRWSLVGLLLFLGIASNSSAQTQTQKPVITSIRQERTNVVVVASVPAGLRRVTLESRERFGPGTWEPRAVARLDGAGGLVTFRLPVSRQLELLRVRGDATERLPAAFYAGTNSFPGEASSSGTPDGIVAFTDGRGTTFGPAAPAEPSREVVESDIWKIDGHTLYFFNQYRGLQVIDISDPDAAVVRGTLDLPAAGEDMYLLDSGQVVLLARDGCGYNGSESQVLIVDVDSGTPTVTARLPVPGYIQESRLVGTALYVASQTYRPTATNTYTWEWGTLVSAFDLAFPEAPVSQDTLWYPGYGNVVAATDRYLFVVTYNPTNWWQSLVQLADISAPDGTMFALSTLSPAGHVPDKFKINVSGDVLTLISQFQQSTNLLTKLETFSLADPAAPRKLGDLTLGVNEQLHATRFEGDRAYVVTFHVQFRLDPLWVVDLSNPAQPAITGQLEIPGWSTYLQPLGDRLVALGIETNRTTVSLFDVADPTQPALLSRVGLGSGWSWSEANNDEKAFGVFPEAGLILVPFQSWDTNGAMLRVQLVDLGADSLAARGVIEHQFQPRRATLYHDRILSLAGRELLSVDATDRDHPVLRGRTELAWPVDWVFLHGEHLLELSAGTRSWGWLDYCLCASVFSQPVLRVTTAGDPNQVLGSLDLDNLPVLGATKQGNYLYLAQAVGGVYPPLYRVYDVTAGTDSAAAYSNGPPLLMTIINLENLPRLSVAGRVEISLENPLAFWGGGLQAVWPKPDLLVWVGAGLGWWDGPIPMMVGGPAPVGGVGFAPTVIGYYPWYWPADGVRLFAFNVSNPTAPSFASQVNLRGTNRWCFSPAFTAEGMVYLSHQSSEFVPGLETPWTYPARTNITVDPTTGQYQTNVMPAGSWVQRYYLDVVDYGDAQQPTVRQPVSISGPLQGVSHQGALLYALSTQWSRAANGSIISSAKLDALAYDGASAYLVTSLPLPNTSPRPVRVIANNVFLGRSGYDYTTTNRYPNYLESWTVSDDRKFTPLGRLALDAPASALEVFPGMLAVQQSDGAVVLVDVADPAALKVLGRSNSAGCYWYDLKHADGDAARGLWLPRGGFGVGRIPVAKD